MFKSVRLFLICSVISMSCLAGPTTLDCQSSSKFEVNLDELETVAAVVDDCPKPKGGKFLNFCTLVENQDARYKKELISMSCADPAKDSPTTVKTKVGYMWEKYYDEFGCDDAGFLVPQGNILKYSINQEFENFVYGVVEEFNLNINLKDPADGKTLLDFTLDEINRYKKRPEYQYKVKELQGIYNNLKNNLKAKHASEL